MPNFLRGGLKEGFVKMSPYGTAVSEARARRRPTRSRPQMMKGDFVIFKGPLKDNTGKVVIPAGTAHEADRPGAREDELPGRGRHRQGLTRRRRDTATLPARGRARCGRLGGRPRRSRSPLGALAAAMLLFGVFVALLGQEPARGLRADLPGRRSPARSPGRTRCQRAAPLILTALCVALPAQAGLVVIGGEGALVLGGLAAAVTGHALAGARAAGGQARDGAGRHARRRRCGSRSPARCASTAASTRRSAACCSPTSPSRCSTTSSKGRCAIRRA